MGKATIVLVVLVMVMGCAPSLFITPAQQAPDGTTFYSVVTKTNGHPAETAVQTYRMDGGKGEKVADHAGSAKGAAVDIVSAGIQNTGAALALGLPASQLRPDTTSIQTNVKASSKGSSANAFQAQGQGQLQGQLQGQAQQAKSAATSTSSGGFIPPGHQD